MSDAGLPPAGLRRALLAFYDASARDLPWRRDRRPWPVWVSEIMCQQTRVDTVVPYFERFLARFPTPASLAEASEDEVLGLWSGLGYYRRARLLHRGAKEVVARYGGEVPAGREERLALPGVGRYTAGAIGSIAFDAPEPVVDGNVSRVLSRLRRIETPLGRADTDKRLWAEAERLVFGPRPGDLNQALMELGATVCTPKKPRCDACPLARACAAREAGLAERLPVPKAKKPPVPTHLVAVVATAKGQVLLRRAEEGGLFRGLFGPPTLTTRPAEPAQLGLLDAAPSAAPPTDTGGAPLPPPDAEAARAALGAAGLAGRVEAAPRGQVEHVLSHRRLFVTVFRATAARARSRDPALRAFGPDALREVGISRLTRKVLAAGGFEA
ncbi:MAG: A/G-specific adenine glycosylase [Myxococcota bacterium]